MKKKLRFASTEWWKTGRTKGEKKKIRDIKRPKKLF